METTSSRDDMPTLMALGAVAATVSALAHETLGHGGVCVAVGGHITLLTSIRFHCLGATPLTDAAGPLGNAFAAALSLLLLRLCRPTAAATRLFLTFVAAINAFWLAGQMVYSAALNTEDLAFVARDLGWPHSWRVLTALLGIVLYVACGRIMTQAMRDLIVPGERAAQTRRRIAIAYLASAASAAIAGAMWRGDPWGSAFNGLLAIAIAPLGMWIGVARATRLGSRDATMVPIARSWAWVVGGGVLFVLFALTQGRGIGPLS